MDSSRPQARFWFEMEMESPEVVPFAGGTVGVFTARSPAKETANEDALALVSIGPDHGIVALADGAGGLRSGEEASRTALETLVTVILEAAGDLREDDSGLRAAIVDGIEAANHAVIDSGGGATTLAITELRGGTVRSYHVGDSTILVTGQRGRLRMQTIAHSPVGYAVESGLLDDAEAMVHEDRHFVSNLLGAADMRIEIGPALELRTFDSLLLASDGLSDNVYLAEIVSRIRKGPIDHALARLLERCRQRMCEPGEDEPSKPDDHTFALFRPRSAA